jgi:hypothetical protein
MAWRQSRREKESAGLRRDPALGRLLSALQPAREVLPWRAVERLVAEAPAAPASWWAGLAYAGGRQLRYATALVLLLGLGTGVLAVLPAHSDQVGTVILTQLPGVWPVGSPAFREVEQAAQAQFAALAVPQSDLYVEVGPGRGRQQLAFALLGVNRERAAGFYSVLKAKYPALAAFPVEYLAIDTDRVGSLLHELALRAVRPALLRPLSQDELRLQLLRALKGCGFEDIKISVRRGADGTTYIEVDARMKFAVVGRTQEELDAAGLNEQLLGPEAYRQVLDNLARPK